MNTRDAQQIVREAVNWFPKESTGRLILKSFELDEYNGEAFAPPVPFSKFTELDEWTLSKDNASVAARIRYAQETMDTGEFLLRSSVYLTHEKGYCFLILGDEQVDVARKRRGDDGLQSVTLSFSEEGGSEELSRFGKGELVVFSGSTPIKGWLYLFSVAANRVITPVYPGEGMMSDVHLSQNSDTKIWERVNKARRKEAHRQQQKHMPLRFCGDAKGFERLIVMIIRADDPVPVTISHLRSRFPLSFLFAHEVIHKGVGDSPIDSCNDLASLPLDKIAIGTLDYFYEG